MKKVSLCAIIGAAGLLSATAAYAFDASSVSQGVNYNAQTQIGVNNIQGAVQGISGHNHIDTVVDLGDLRTFQDSSAEGGNARAFFGARGGRAESDTALKIGSKAFITGSIVDSGNGGKGGYVGVKNIAKIDDPEVDIDADGGRARAFLGRASGGDAEVEKVAQLNGAANVALLKDNGNGGNGGKIEQNSDHSGNWKIENTSTSIAVNATKGANVGGLQLKDNLLNVVNDSAFTSIKNED
jgi:hypothetical protein